MSGQSWPVRSELGCPREAVQRCFPICAGMLGLSAINRCFQICAGMSGLELSDLSLAGLRLSGLSWNVWSEAVTVQSQLECLV